MAQKCFSAARWTILVTVLAAFAHHAGALSVGDKTACAIESATGRLRCWGRGQNTNSPDAGDYYSGADDLGDLIVPTDLHTNAFDVVVMESHVCAIKAAALDAAKGKLACFKAGSDTPITLAFRGPGAEQPDLAATDFVRLSGKGEQVCALDETGKLSCWSETNFTSSWTAQDWTNAASKKYKSVSVGYDHMCAILLCDDSWECFGPPSVITATSETTKIPAKYVDGNNANAQIVKATALKSISCGKGVSVPCSF